ncbi:uncharacterized protein PITG_15885 [Phytophthora infestans T30-4]|uniref:DDE-1 domain-containing protein n=1 Tax=Phytophthora infestans (strain T30-4) TaxID=403677 RepID=D0NRZ3_PHYIT|nr:uncharacterized protein PITG_15885 [Phytophthora infestans T30-4]EEY63534.1 conserved hypothetical protein [Phytophthora infestans T30-4]|eukprot:XP_002898121.1 conserved hypothetical protein [Phytophthora infestans T30-4]
MAPTYTVDFKQATIAQVQAGSTVADIAAVTGVHERTIRKWLHALAEGKSLKAGWPGPKTLLPKVAEDHLYDWVEVGLLGGGERVGHGCPLAKLIIELKLDSSRVFNMDEMAFHKQLKSKKVVAVRGSSNVWNTGLQLIFTSQLSRVEVLLALYPYSEEVLAAAEHLNVMLVFLPLNTTHLLQPLDVAVFATLKSKIQTLLGEIVEEVENGYYNISKDDAIQVGSMAWRGARIDRKFKARFKACGLFPLSLVKMGARLNNFTRNGAPHYVLLATWLHMKALVEGEILTMPAPPSKGRGQKRKRVSVGGRLLTHEVLQEIEASTARSGAKGRKHGAKPCKKTTSMSPSAATGSDIVDSTVV